MKSTERERLDEKGVPLRRHRRTLLFRGLVGVVLVALAILVLWVTGSGAFLWEIFSDRERIQRVVSGAGVLGPVVFVAFLVAQAVIAPLPAPAVAMAGGYSFGVWEGFVLTWFGALLGGVISFWISRLVGRDFVAGSERAKRLDRYVEEHGAIMIFVLRLLPLVSFDAISYAAGLSSIPFRKFLLATALGMLPGTFAFVYLAGASSTTGVWAVLIGLAALAIAAYAYQRRYLEIRRRVN